MNYTKVYLQLLRESIDRAPEFGITRPCMINTDKVRDDNFERANYLIQREWPKITNSISGYLGNRCVALASIVFALLVSHGFKADIVIGTVHHRGERVFPCTVETLLKEVRSPGGVDDAVAMHAWVTLGGDTIIDGGMLSRLVRTGEAPERFDRQYFWTRAGLLSQKSDMQYHPLVVGSQFIALINEIDPWIQVEAYRAMLSGKMPQKVA